MNSENFYVGSAKGKVRVTTVGEKGGYTPARTSKYSQTVETDRSFETIVADGVDLSSVKVTAEGIEIKADKIKLI